MPEQLIDNLGATQVWLDNEHIDQLDAVSALPSEYPAWMVNPAVLRPAAFGRGKDGAEESGVRDCGYEVEKRGAKKLVLSERK